MSCREKVRVLGTADTICPVCQRGSFDGKTHVNCRKRGTPDGLTSFFRYEGVVKQALKTIKYRGAYDVARELVDMVPPTSYNMLPSFDPAKSVLIPIPLHVSRFRERGFNQAELLGSLVAARLGIKMRTDILVRTRETTPQVEMHNRSERIKNMDGVFALAPGARLDGVETVFLFDDVYTTGATMLNSAFVIISSFSSIVWVISMAR